MDTSIKKPNDKFGLLIIVILIGFLKGVALGISFGIAALFRTLIIDSDSLTVSLIRDGIVPFGITVLLFQVASKTMNKLGLTMKSQNLAGQFMAILTGIVGFMAGIVFYIAVRIKATILYQTSIGTGNEILYEFLLFLVFVAMILFVYKLLRK